MRAFFCALLASKYKFKECFLKRRNRSAFLERLIFFKKNCQTVLNTTLFMLKKCFHVLHDSDFVYFIYIKEQLQGLCLLFQSGVITVILHSNVV
jgi:hypothetical protein